MDAPFIAFIAIAALTALLGGLMVTLVWAMAMQRQALIRQRQSLFQLEESLELSRRNVEISGRLLQLAEQSVGNQEEMIRLLKELTGRPAEGASAFHGVRLPEGAPPPPRG